MTNTAWNTYLEQAREMGLDYAEAVEQADRKSAADALRAGEAAATDDLTVTVRSERYTIPGALLDHIAFERNRARVAGQMREVRREVMIRTDLRKRVMEEFGVDADTAHRILSTVRQAPVAGWRPESLELAVRWERGWKVYDVTGTRHAYYLLRKLAQRDGFQQARLNEPLVRQDGWIIPNVLTLELDDILGHGDPAKYTGLLNRSNTHYDLAR